MAQVIQTLEFMSDLSYLISNGNPVLIDEDYMKNPHSNQSSRQTTRARLENGQKFRDATPTENSKKTPQTDTLDNNNSAVTNQQPIKQTIKTSRQKGEQPIKEQPSSRKAKNTPNVRSRDHRKQISPNPKVQPPESEYLSRISGRVDVLEKNYSSMESRIGKQFFEMRNNLHAKDTQRNAQLNEVTRLKDNLDKFKESILQIIRSIKPKE